MQFCWKNTICYLLTFPVSCVKVYHGCGLYVYSSWWQAVQRISHGVYERSWASPWRTKLPSSMFSNAVLAMLSQQRLPSPGHVRRMEKERLLKDLFYGQLELCKRQQSLPQLLQNDPNSANIDIGTWRWALWPQHNAHLRGFSQGNKGGRRSTLPVRERREKRLVGGSQCIQDGIIFICDVSNKNCHSSIGLHSHHRPSSRSASEHNISSS